MIAAIALEHGLELVTGNTAHFQRVQQLGYPLILANWQILTPLPPPSRNGLANAPAMVIW